MTDEHHSTDEEVKQQEATSLPVDRRTFLASAAAAGVGAMFGPAVRPGMASASEDGLRVAIIGTGSQGLVLLRDALKIPGIHFAAVCDIWDAYSQRYGAGVIRAAGQGMPNLYVDYREMLASEDDLDAAIIATPDWVHAEQTVACLEAGLHVYCEKEMSNSVQEARRIVEAARTSGKKVQIGHQRRSNPFYQHGLQLIREDRALGRITTCRGQWHRASQPQTEVPERLAIPNKVLKRYGYGTMRRFRNWRWYRQYSGGPMADLGSHQVDVFNWFLGTAPKSVYAIAGADYFEDEREWYSDALSVYQYETENGSVRAFYEVLNTSSFGGYYEVFMGDHGALSISEDLSKCFYVPEPTKEAPKWVDQADRVEKEGASAIQLIGESRKSEEQERESLMTSQEKPIYQLHLENFFSAIRDGAELTCPPEIGYETCVSVLKVNEALAMGQPRPFSPTEFRV